MVSAIQTSVDFQIEIVPADGIGLSFFRRGDFGTSPFWAALSQGDPLDHVATYHSCCITHREFTSSLGEESSSAKSFPELFVQHGGRELDP
jgi:hypothetical protein